MYTLCLKRQYNTGGDQTLIKLVQNEFNCDVSSNL